MPHKSVGNPAPAEAQKWEGRTLKSVYNLFFTPGEVTEIRAINAPRGKHAAWEGYSQGTISGYFDNAEEFGKAAAALDKIGAKGIYFSLNPCNPALIARAANRLKVPKSTTQDVDVVCIRWLPIDLDPKRPSDISATDEEVKAAEDVARNIAAWLEGELGFARAIRGFSGNGYHLLYRLPDLPNNDETQGLIKGAIAALVAKFDSPAVDIDVKVVNPARIWKLFGTTGRKGDSTTDRPHRPSRLFPGQPGALSEVPVTELETLRKLAKTNAAAGAPPASPGETTAVTSGAGAQNAPGRTRPMSRQELGPVDVEAYLNHYGISFTVKSQGGRTLYCLEECLFDPNHRAGQASIVVPQYGPMAYQCFHASCKSYTWKDARKKISGDKSLAEFCAGYDPNWKPPQQEGTGLIRDMALPPTRYATPALQNGADADAPLVPPPAEMDPREFYEKKGKRPVFVPFYLTKYLAAYLHPICHTNGTFYHYCGGYWKEFTKTALAEICVHTLKQEIQSAWIENAIKILAGYVNREEADWPDNPMLINVLNGMYDMESGQLVPHDPQYGSRTQLPVHYDPAAWSERWHKFLQFVFEDDKETMGKYFMLQQFFGYCLLRDCRYQRALFLYGTGANGKSTVIDVLQAMVGRENTSSLTLTDVTKTFRSAFMQNKLVNLATETNTRDPLMLETFKAVITGDSITAERKYGEPFQYRPYAKWVVAMNEAPVIPDKSYGFGRRIIVLNFQRRIEDHEIIPNMSELLIEDIDAIFTWAVEGLRALLRQGQFNIPEQVDNDTTSFMTSMNPMLIFVNECCELYPQASVSTMDIWHAYTAWCADGRNRPYGRNKFFELLLATFPTLTRGRVRSGDDDGDDDSAGEATSRGQKGRRETSIIGIRLDATGREFAEKGQRKSERMFE